MEKPLPSGVPHVSLACRHVGTDSGAEKTPSRTQPARHREASDLDHGAGNPRLSRARDTYLRPFSHRNSPVNKSDGTVAVGTYLHVHLLVSQPGRGIALIIRRKPLTKPLSARASTSASAQLHAAATSPSFRHKHCRAEATVGASHATRPQLLQLHQKAISLLIHRPPLSPSLPTYVACIPLLLPTCCNSFLFHIPQL
jgi:hypothetical protein